jgi:hypothetical protein
MRNVFIVLVSVAVVMALFQLTSAGSLTPSFAPASTFHTLEDIYASLASTSYDASSITASKTGSALQISKCIILKLTGGTPCP